MISISLTSYHYHFIPINYALFMFSYWIKSKYCFYAWRFYKTDSLDDITLVNSKINKNLPITWRSPQLGSSQYKPHDIYSSLKQVPQNKKFDIVIMGCSSLQDFQGVCAGLKNFVHQDSIILVELSGYVNLEPYVTANFAKSPVNVVSIMNESDVRIIRSNEYSHQLRNNDSRIYIGSTSGSSKIANNKNFQKFTNYCSKFKNNHIVPSLC